MKNNNFGRNFMQEITDQTTVSPDEIIWEFHKLHQKMYDEHGLTSLTGLNREYRLQGRNLLMWHSEATRKCSLKYSNRYYFSKNFDDILFCSEEILYFTGSLYVYKPYINNPLDDAAYFSGRMVYPNYQNHYGKRYGMFGDIASQCVYNFWDRIGDMIAAFFPDKINSTRVFFTTALDIIPPQFHSNENYIWLDNFRRTEYKEVNDRRKQVVHYTTIETDFKYQHLEKGSNDREAMEKIQAEREALPDYYKKHIDYSLEGMAKALLMLEEIGNTLFSDIA
ncbi:MAG: Cthe_2314 family HEPN domain-containing protein [Bacteroidia bacterium]